MLKFRHKTMIVFSGLIWLAVGVSLLSLGLHLIVDATELPEGYYPLLHSLTSVIGSLDSAALLIICVALAIGYFKGRYILVKSVRRVVKRISESPDPMSLLNLYGWGYYALIGGMMLLGMAIKFFGVAGDVRGLVDTAVGAALINGAMLYFRCAAVHGKEAHL